MELKEHENIAKTSTPSKQHSMNSKENTAIAILFASVIVCAYIAILPYTLEAYFIMSLSNIATICGF